MRRVLLAVSLLMIVALAAGHSVPVFLWGSTPYFRNSLVSSTVITTEKLGSAIPQFIGKSISERPPKAVVTFLQKELRAPQVARMLGAYGGKAQLPNLRTTLSGHSLSIPSVRLTGSVVSGLQSAVKATTITTSSAYTSCAKLVETVEAAMKTKGMTMDAPASASSTPRFIVFNSETLESLVDFDACIPTLSAKLSEITNDNFLVSLSAGTDTTDVEVVFHSVQEEITEAAEFQSFVSSQAQLLDTYALVGVTRVTPNIVTGLVIGIMLLLIVIIGFNCALAIETPVRYATPAMLLPHTKEY